MKPAHQPLAPPNSWVRLLASGLGLAVALGGLIVVVGWWLRVDSLVQAGAEFEAVKVNTGLGVACLGAALFFLIGGPHKLTWLGLVPAGLGLLTLIEHLAGVDLGIDQLLARDYLAGPATLHPGRMAPVSALCLVAAGLAVTPLFGSRPARRALGLGLAGSLYASIGSAGILGHLLSLPGGYGWAGGGGLSPYAGALALLVGLALLAAAWRIHETSTDAPPGWMPLPVIVASVALTVILYTGLRERERFFSADTARNNLNNLASAIVLEIERESAELERIARRWSLLEGPSEIVREADARGFISERRSSEARADAAPGAHSVAWLGNDGRVRWFYPPEGNEGLTGFDHSREPLRAEAMLRARGTGLPAVSGTLIVPGRGAGFAVYAPILTVGGSTGYATADYTYARLFESLEARLRYGESHDYSIQVGGVPVFDTRDAVRRDEPIAEAIESSLIILDRRVRIAFSPASGADALSRRRLPEVALLTGLGITFLLGLSVHLARVARAGQRLTEQANTQLRGEIEERRQAEAALRASQLAERKLGLVAARTDNIVVIARPDGAVDWVNDAFTRLLGRPLAEVAGRPAVDILASADPEAAFRLRSALGSGDPLSTDVSSRSASGRPYELSLDLQPVYAADGRLENFILLAADITQRVETERELRRAKIEADAASRAKSDFLASMSHEIRTPMNGVIGMTSLLLHTPLNHDQRDSVNTIRQSGETLLAIINDILDFSKIESGHLELETIPFDLTALVEETLDLFAPVASSRGLDLAYRVDPAVPAWIETDPTRLRQILANLVNNAVKFTPTGSVSIEIASAPGHTIEFRVRDTGIGIPPDRIGRLFKAFSQVDSSTTRKYGGTGLGLVICQRLTALMGGQIIVESVVGEGSVFRFAIPLRPATPATTEPPAPAPAVRPVVLVLEAQPLNRRRLVEQITAQLGPALAPAEPAQLGATLAESGLRPTLILADPAFLALDPTGALLPALRALAAPVVWLHPIGHPPADPALLGPVHAKLARPARTGFVLAALRRHLGLETTRHQTAPTLDVTPLGETIPLSILLVEDNLVNQKVALRFLERLGYRADAVANGLESLRALEARPYDLVFMDLQMPEMDGFEASREIRNTLPADRQPRIIALTANALQGDREACLAAGMDDYITKPVKLPDIAASIQRQFAHRDPAAPG